MDTRLNLEQLKAMAATVRVDVVTMLAQAGSGHPGGSLSSTDILVALYFNLMNVDPRHPAWEGRDRFHLSKGHGCPALYAVLARRGYFSLDELGKLRTMGSMLQGHPHPKTPGVEVASGSLGQGLSVASGMALADRLDGKQNNTFVIMGDGEMQEGQIWEGAMFAAHYKLDHLIAFIDHNGLQIDGKVEKIMNVEPLADKWTAFGFETVVIDGHNMATILNTVETMRAHKNGKPKALIALTVKGKGVSFMEHNVDFHGRSPNPDETKQALGELRGA